MSTSYDKNGDWFNETNASPTKKEIVGQFRAWIVSTRSDLSLSALRIRREIRDGLPLTRFSLEVCEEHSEFCVELAAIESELAFLDTHYLWAAQNEGDEWIDFSSPSMLLLWERFAAQKDREQE